MILTVLFSVVMSSNDRFVSLVHVVSLKLSSILLQFGFSLGSKAAVEAVVTLVNWPVTYFFIRRAMNPEIGLQGAFEKYGCDALFGAFAASVTVILKEILLNKYKI